METARYRFVPTATETDFPVRRYASFVPPSLPRRDSDVYLLTQEGDRLDLLAREYYGDERAWWVIASVNNVGKGSLTLPAGLQLRIPTPTLELERLLIDIQANR